MTLQEAKDHVMRNHDFIPNQWQYVRNEKFHNEAAELYARSKWEEAIQKYEKLNDIQFPIVPEFNL